MPHHRARRRPSLTALGVALGVSVAGAVAGCGNSPAAAPVAAAATERPATVAPPSCEEQYSAWKKGPARAPGRKLTAALDAVQSAGNSDDIPDETAALEKAGTAAVVLLRYPMPACVDPHGYWNSILDRIRAAGDNAGTNSGLSALLLAEVPLKDVPSFEKKLDAELKKTT
jgi:hypothetical protein